MMTFKVLLVVACFIVYCYVLDTADERGGRRSMFTLLAAVVGAFVHAWAAFGLLLLSLT
jgi:hypothetical protein